MTTDAVEDLLAEHQRGIYTFCYYYLGRPQDAEDVTQEVLVKLWRHHGTVDPDRLGAWTRQVTRNCCVDWLRRKRRHRALVVENGYEAASATVADPNVDPVGETVSRELCAAVEAEMRTLEDPFRTVLIMREIQDMSYNEIREVLDLPLNTVKSYLHRGRKMLRERLSKEVLCESRDA